MGSLAAVLLLWLLNALLTFAIAQPLIRLPQAGIEARHLAVVYLKNDPESLAIANYYQQQRSIPAENIVAVEFDSNQHTVDPGVFAVQKAVIEAQLPEAIQAYALAWTKPFRVGCMGMTAAFAFGYDVSYCANGCKKTRRSAYHHTTSVRPYDNFSIRPTMMLAGNSTESIKRLIDRGVSADDKQPEASALLLKTADKSRSIRRRYFPEFKNEFSTQLNIKIFDADAVFERSDILFYFTGAKAVEGLETLSFLPGAIADHLTSHGGTLVNSSQMSAVEWLEAGATASYGTAIEPCNFLEKFPDPRLIARYYLRGNTALEAYWKSVVMPGQGNFIGEPLAKPFRGYRMRRGDNSWEIESPVFYPGYYDIYAGSLFGETLLETKLFRKGENSISLRPPFAQSYRIERKRL